MKSIKTFLVSLFVAIVIWSSMDIQATLAAKPNNPLRDKVVAFGLVSGDEPLVLYDGTDNFIVERLSMGDYLITVLEPMDCFKGSENGRVFSFEPLAMILVSSNDSRRVAGARLGSRLGGPTDECVDFQFPFRVGIYTTDTQQRTDSTFHFQIIGNKPQK